MVFVAVVVLLVAAALPAAVVAEWTRPRRVSQATRTVRSVALVPMMALPMLWASVGFVFLLSPECFVVPAFGEDVLWVQDQRASTVDPGGAGTTWTSCSGASASSDASRRRLSSEGVRTQLCGPTTFNVFDGVGGAVVWQWSRGDWSCLSSTVRGGYGRGELGLWTSPDRSRVAYACRALGPDIDATEAPFNTRPPLLLRAVHEARGPHEDLTFVAITFFVAALAMSAGAIAWLQRADRRRRSSLFAPEVPPTDDDEDEREVGLTPFRTSRLTKPAPPPHRSPRRAAFERGLRLRWTVVAALFAAGLLASIAALTHHGYAPGRPLVSTRPFMDVTL